MDEDIRVLALGLLVRRLRMHSEVSDADAGAIRALPGELRQLRARSDFVHLREAVDHSCLVAEGIVGHYVQLENGSRQIVSGHIPGDLVDLHSLMLPRAPIPLTTIGAATILRIPHAALRALLAAHPALVTVMWRDTVVDASTIAQWTVNVGRRDARERVAHLMCEMAVRTDAIGLLDRLSYPLPITQEQLGDMLALTSVHVNRVLRVLREEGLARFTGGRVDILDWPRLQDACGFDAAYLSSIVRSERLTRIRQGR